MSERTFLHSLMICCTPRFSHHWTGSKYWPFWAKVDAIWMLLIVLFQATREMQMARNAEINQVKLSNTYYSQSFQRKYQILPLKSEYIFCRNRLSNVQFLFLSQSVHRVDQACLSCVFHQECRCGNDLPQMVECHIA